METLHGYALGKRLRTLSDAARNRVSIVSPYIGRWPAVKALLGANWWTGSLLELRVITDVSVTKNVNLASLYRLGTRGTVKSLPGVHAKVYIFDDVAIVSSANLTETAFTKRREVGLLLSEREAEDTIKLFETWWKYNCKDISEAEFLAWDKSGIPSGIEQEGLGLPVLWGLPESPEDGLFENDGALARTFSRYRLFLKSYSELANIYISNQRLWPDSPVYIEVDSFLDYMFHQADGTPSHDYYHTIEPRQLTLDRQTSEISKWAVRYANWLRAQKNERWRDANVKKVQSLLNRQAIDILTFDGAKEVADCINAMGAYPPNKTKFLNPMNNSIQTIRSAWKDLLHGSGTEEARIGRCNSALISFGTSSIQELLGWYYPQKFPLKNGNSDAGLLFFGFKV